MDDNDDNDDNNSIAFSVKRRRISKNESSTSEYATQTCQHRRKKRILHLPDEILCLIFNKLSYDDICKNIIPVCNRFKVNAINILNITFCNTEKRINRIRAWILSNNNKFNVEKEPILIYRILSILDLLGDQYKMLRASIWRFSYFKLITVDTNLKNRAGVILDQFNILFNILKNVDNVESLMRIVPSEIRKIKDVVKDYIEKFERFISITFKNVPFISGSKFIDLLDCFIGVERKIVLEKYEKNLCNLKITYSVDRSWFTVLPIDHISSSDMNLFRDIRFMYKRLSRIVRINNGSVIGESLLLQSNYNPFLFRNTLPYQLYCGYGEINGKFYFYGIMKEGQSLGNTDITNDNDGDNEEENQNRINEQDEALPLSVFQHSKTKLTFEISLSCSLYLAPWFIINKYNKDGDLNMVPLVEMMEKKQMKSKSRRHFHFNLTITSLAAKENRLPYQFNYQITQMNGEIESVIVQGKNVETIV